jgi:hypothetical protein
MGSATNLLNAALQGLGPRPSDSAAQKHKKRYSEQLSEAVAQTLAEELRKRGLKGARPAPPGVLDTSGAERRMAGGIGAKKVDVTWATEQSGLLLALSIKSINFKDKSTNNYQKNLTNRRGDMLFEAVTLHRRFPFAVLAGFFFFDQGALRDETTTRRSTVNNAHDAFKLFTDRPDPAAREEQFERFYIAVHHPDSTPPRADFYRAGHPAQPVPLEDIFDELIKLVAERNADFYEEASGKLRVRKSKS